MRARPSYLLAVPVLASLAVIAAVRVTSPRPPGDEMVEVLVVRSDLPVLTPLDESAMRSHIGRARVRKDQVPADAVNDERLVLGKTVCRTLRAGEYLSAADVGRPILDFVSHDAPRAMSVQLGPDDRSADTLRPGDRVNLFVSVPVGGGRVASVPVLDGLLVLAARTGDRVVCVAVTPAQAEAIRAAEYRGELRVRSGLVKQRPRDL